MIEPSVIVTEQARVRVVTLTDALVQPWALTFLPDGDILITERGGRLRLIHEGRLASGSIGGIPPVDTRTQDGLMDLALHPRFAQNRTSTSRTRNRASAATRQHSRARGSTVRGREAP